jgi:hypothetical protein
MGGPITNQGIIFAVGVEFVPGQPSLTLIEYLS